MEGIVIRDLLVPNASRGLWTSRELHGQTDRNALTIMDIPETEWPSLSVFIWKIINEDLESDKVLLEQKLGRPRTHPYYMEVRSHTASKDFMAGLNRDPDFKERLKALDCSLGRHEVDKWYMQVVYPHVDHAHWFAYEDLDHLVIPRSPRMNHGG